MFINTHTLVSLIYSSFTLTFLWIQATLFPCHRHLLELDKAHGCAIIHKKYNKFKNIYTYFFFLSPSISSHLTWWQRLRRRHKTNISEKSVRDNNWKGGREKNLILHFSCAFISLNMHNLNEAFTYELTRTLYYIEWI